MISVSWMFIYLQRWCINKALSSWIKADALSPNMLNQVEQDLARKHLSSLWNDFNGMTATLAVMAFHLLTWQRHFRRQGGCGGVSDRSCPCVSSCMCNGLVFGLIVVREGGMTCQEEFGEISDFSTLRTSHDYKNGCSEGSRFFLFVLFFTSKPSPNAGTTVLYTCLWPELQDTWTTVWDIDGDKMNSVANYKNPLFELKLCTDNISDIETKK